jgi:hypothetical protein
MLRIIKENQEWSLDPQQDMRRGALLLIVVVCYLLVKS